jgi:hypothetical protein
MTNQATGPPLSISAGGRTRGTKTSLMHDA